MFGLKNLERALSNFAQRRREAHQKLRRREAQERQVQCLVRRGTPVEEARETVGLTLTPAERARAMSLSELEKYQIPSNSWLERPKRRF